MRTRPPDPQTVLPLPVSEFQILLALADEERHGYAIKREVASRTNGDVQLGPGTLYGSIKRMVTAGFIEESDERPDPEIDDERRRYYRIHIVRPPGRRRRGPADGAPGRDRAGEAAARSTGAGMIAPRRTHAFPARLVRALVSVVPGRVPVAVRPRDRDARADLVAGDT